MCGVCVAQHSTPEPHTSFATLGPMISGNSRELQNSGTTAMRVKGVQKYAEGVQYTTSQWGSSVVPMPTAGPLTAAISCAHRRAWEGGGGYGMPVGHSTFTSRGPVVVSGRESRMSHASTGRYAWAKTTTHQLREVDDGLHEHAHGLDDG